MRTAEVEAAHPRSPEPAWMGWEREALEGVLRDGPDLSDFGASLDRALCGRVLGDEGGSHLFYLFVRHEHEDRYELVGTWGVEIGEPSAEGSSRSAETALEEPEFLRGALIGKSVEGGEFFLPLETQEEILGFGLLLAGPGMQATAVPEADLSFLSRIGGETLARWKQSRRIETVQQALAAATRYLERILSLTGDGILLVDPEGKILAANQPVEIMLGRLTLDLIGEPLSSVVSGESGVSLLAGLELAARQDVTVTRTLRLRGASGADDPGPRTVEATLERVDVGSDRPSGVLICLRDLDQISREDWFAQSEQTRDRALSRLSQSLLRPVAALRGYIWLLREEVGTEGRLGEMARSLDLQTETMQSQLETLALMDQFRGSRVDWRDQPVPPFTLFERALGRTRSGLEARGIQVRNLVPGEVPWVRVDVEKWVLVLSYLMDQVARRLGGPGILVLEVRLRTSHPARVQFRVAGERAPRGEARSLPVYNDGNSPEFTMGEDGQSAEGGVIYGLPLARTVVHHYGGTLLWDWERGGGAAVTLTLPVERDASFHESSGSWH